VEVAIGKEMGRLLAEMSGISQMTLNGAQGKVGDLATYRHEHEHDPLARLQAQSKQELRSVGSRADSLRQAEVRHSAIDCCFQPRPNIKPVSAGPSEGTVMCYILSILNSRLRGWGIRMNLLS
jgi:hypothetical protein